MALSFVGDDSAAATSVTIPAHQVGDLIVIFAYRDGGTTAPSLPAAGGTVPTWTDIRIAAGVSNSARASYAIATATNHTSGTWTNASGIAVVVLRGAGTGVAGDPPIGFSSAAAATVDGSTGVSAPASDLATADGTSAILRFYAHRAATAWDAAPSGYTRLTEVATELALNKQDTTTSSGAAVQTLTAVSSGSVGMTVEVLQAAVDYTESPKFDKATVNVRTTTDDPYEFTHTPVGTPRAVVVLVNSYQVGTDDVTAITYGGEALTEVVQAAETGSEQANVQLWFLGTGIPTGAQTVSVDLASATTADMIVACVTYTADADCEVVDSDKIEVDTNNPSVTLSAGGRDCAGIAAIMQGTPSLANMFEMAGMIGIHEQTTGVDTQRLSRRPHPLATDWVAGYNTPVGADDVALAAFIFAESSSAATGSASLEITFGVVSAGTAKAYGSSQTGLTFGVVSAGKAKAYGSSSLSLGFNAASAGKAHAYGSSAVPITFGVDSAGTVPQTTGSSELALTFGVTSAGVAKAYGSSSLALTFGATSAGYAKAYGSSDLPIVFGVVSAGERALTTLADAEAPRIALPVTGYILSGATGRIEFPHRPEIEVS